MKVSELKAGQGKVDIDVVVKTLSEPRVMEKYGKELKVCNAVVSDDSGDIALTLWNDDVDKVKQGNTIRITNGYVSEFNGQKQLTSGKYGKLEVVSGKDSKEEGKKESNKKEDKKKEEDIGDVESEEEIEDVEF